MKRRRALAAFMVLGTFAFYTWDRASAQTRLAEMQLIGTIKSVSGILPSAVCRAPCPLGGIAATVTVAALNAPQFTRSATIHPGTQVMHKNMLVPANILTVGTVVVARQTLIQGVYKTTRIDIIRTR